MQGPSKNIAVLGIIVSLIVISIIGASIREKFISNREPEKKVQNILALEVISREQSILDSDNDGLFDWEEELRLTDPNNPDTDGDGTIDGIEIRAQRDPLVAGPDDSIADEIEKEETEVIYPKYTSGTISDQWSTNAIKNFFNNINNPEFTPEAADQLLLALQTDVEALTEVAQKYSVNNVKTIETTNESLKNYGNELATVNNSYLQKLTSISGSDSADYLNELALFFIQTSGSLIKLQVPITLSEIQVAMANNLFKVGLAISTINNQYETDPLKALLSIKDYEEAANSQKDLQSIVAKYFKDNGIIFENDEPGNIWNNIQ